MIRAQSGAVCKGCWRHPPHTARSAAYRVQRGNRLQTPAFFSSLLPPTNPPYPSHGFHSRHILLPVGHRFFFWAASSLLLWSSGGIIVVTMVVPFTVPPDLPPTKAARPIAYQSRPKKRCPLAHPLTSYHRRNVHSLLVLRGYYGRAVCFPLVAPRFARLLESQRTLIITLSVYVAPTSTYDTCTKETPIVPRFQTLLTKVKAQNPNHLQTGVYKNTPKLTLKRR